MAINPPNIGNFPDGFWEEMYDENIGMKYGDPGWTKKINDWKNNSNRNTQLTFNIPVLLGKYADAPGTFFSATDFQNLLFDNNPTGSMKEYYDEISYGNFTLDGSTGGWYQSSYTMSQAKDNARLYVSEIAQLADADFDYSQYDNDGPDNIPNSGDDDGYVDGIAVVYSGCGAEWYPGNNNLWPHCSSLGSYAYTTNDISANGNYIIVSSYFVSPELYGGGDCNTNLIRPMGVYAHEFGHILGLPDLYDRDDSSEGIGYWCLMAAGSWNGVAGDTPAHMSTWCKKEMGWLNPTNYSSDIDNVEIAQIENNPYAIQIWEDDYFHSRYFLIENRQLTGFDSEIPGSGLLIYHIDENQGFGHDSWSLGSANDNELSKLVDLEEADGLDDLDSLVNRGDNGDPYPGSSNNYNFNDFSYPNSFGPGNVSTGITITNISNSDSIMTVDLQLKNKNGYAIYYDTNGMSGWYIPSSGQNNWAAVLFTADYPGYLSEIDIGVMDYNSDWIIKIYNSFDGVMPGMLLQELSGFTENRGWVSVEVDSINLTADQEFFIVVDYGTNSKSICVENLNEGMSYHSSDGLNFYQSNNEFNIRAKVKSDNYVSTHNQDKVLPVSILLPNYPNPFNPSTTISYILPLYSHVKLNIFDINGRNISTLININKPAGKHKIKWDSRDNQGKLVPNGVYFYTMTTNKNTQTNKMIFIK